MNARQVSLYQILPKKQPVPSEWAAPNQAGNSSSAAAAAAAAASSGLDKEFPLRLLDIRRIDLDSSGWETFYVKRAVEDWLREESSNLGRLLAVFYHELLLLLFKTRLSLTLVEIN